jgi:hypothetical protein
VTALERVAAHLAAERVGHALIGAAALAAAGISRSTVDLDLLVTDRRVLSTSFWRPLADPGTTIDVRRGDDEDPLAGVVRIDGSDDRPVDVIVGRETWQARAIARARVGIAPVPIVEPRDLVLLKLYAGGPQDLWDVRQLLALPNASELAAAVEGDLAELPAELGRRWAEVRR